MVGLASFADEDDDAAEDEELVDVLLEASADSDVLELESAASSSADSGA